MWVQFKKTNCMRMFPLHAVHFANWILDKPVFRAYNTHNFIYCSSAAWSAIGTGGE